MIENTWFKKQGLDLAVEGIPNSDAIAAGTAASITTMKTTAKGKSESIQHAYSQRAGSSSCSYNQQHSLFL